MRRRKGVSTLQDIANLAGVSRATASRALADSPLINTATKQRIKALAKEHDYRINERARDLRLKRSRVISVVFMLDIRSEQHMSDPFFLEMLGGVADRLAERDYDLLLAHAPVKNIAELRNSRVFRQSDGVIFIGQGEQHEQLNDLAAGDVPIVAWGGDLPGRSYCLVGGENEHGGYLATKHLLELGRKRVAFCGNTRPPEIAARFEGYKRALAEAGMALDSDLHIEVPYAMHDARQVFLEILATGARFDAAVCSSDVMALAAIAAFNEAGLSVPENIAVVGYDDIGLAAHSGPPLTTIRQNIRWGGRVLVESVLGLINGEHVADTTLASSLIVRQSCGGADSHFKGPIGANDPGV
jgi:DNA-binding LacI/PurR family transcriptional regulator